MKDAIIAIVVVLLLGVGFWWTRGAAGLPGGTDDPALEQVRGRFDELGDSMPPVGEEYEDREHEIE
jgi:hypothetical protein